MQKRGDGGGIVPQPGTENTAVDGSHRSRGSRLARRIPPHLDRQPARQSVVEAIDIYRFVMYASMPAAKQRSSSPFKALAVTATTGVRPWRRSPSLARIHRTSA